MCNCGGVNNLVCPFVKQFLIIRISSYCSLIYLDVCVNLTRTLLFYLLEFISPFWYMQLKLQYCVTCPQ